MNGWNEDNFLEELIPLLRRKRTANLCPEAEALCAVAHGQTGEGARHALAAHSARCPTCRDLQQHLQAFEAPMVKCQETEWEQTEERLDSWLQSFLQSDAAVYQANRQTTKSHLRLWWRRLASQPISWHTRWVPVAAVVLVICSFLAGRLSAPRPQQLTASATSHRKSSPDPRLSGAVADDRIAEARPDRESRPPQPAPQTQPSPEAVAVVASSAPASTSPAAASPVAARESGLATDTEVITPAAPSNPEDLPSVPESPSMRGGTTTAEVSGTAPSTRAAPSGMRSVLALRGGPSAPARVEHSTEIPSASVIRLEAGTRVWIALRSVRPRADGVSDFRGMVLLPVTQSGAVLLRRDAEVSGTMTVKNGKKSIRMLEFSTTRARYRLRGASGEADMRLLGAGQAVEFDAGRVVETWLASASTYEKLPAESRPPE